MQDSTNIPKNQNLQVSALSSTATLQEIVPSQTNNHIKEQGSKPGSATVSPDASQTALPELKPEEVLLDQGVAPSRKSKGMMSLYLIWMPCFLLTASNGYAHGGMTTINSMTQFQAYFNFTGLGLDTSLVFAALPFGAIATFWLAPLISDNYGRVMGIRFGILTNITGASLIAGAQNVPMLMVGRVLLGVGDAIVSNSCGPYIAETSPAHVRGQFMGSLSVLFCIGTLMACCAGIAGEAIKHTWGWRVVIFGQLALLLIGLVLSGLMKETPRWLVAKGRNEEALAFLTRFHGSGVETAYVKLEYEQIKAASTPLPKGIRDRWNFKTLLGKKGDFHRLSLALMMTTVGQLCGNGLFYFLAGQVGITSVQMQLVMPVIANVVSIFTSLYGSMLWDKYGRRPSLIYGSLGLAVAYAAAMVASSQTGVESYDKIQPSSNQDASRAGIAFLIIAQGVYGLTIATSVWTYPSECLATVQRSTAMGLSTLVFKICLFVNLFAVPIALERIGYWTYLPFILANPIISFIWYMIAVETKGVNLEELDEFFQHPHAVKRSVERARLHRREQKQARVEAV